MRFLRFLLFFVSLSGAALAGINSFTALPTTFLPGQEVALSWNVTEGDVIAITPQVGPVSGATGSVTVIPNGTTTYTLTNSTSGTSAQVVVTQSAPPQLVNRWSFNEGSGTTVLDSIGAQHGVIRGSGSTRSSTQIVLPGGSSSSAAYIDLPNGLVGSTNEITFEGWMTINGAQNWQRYFDFGTTTIGEVSGPGSSFNGTEYISAIAQVGGNQNQRRLAFRESNVENSIDLPETTTPGTQFHFAVVYNSTGNGGQPQMRYYRNGNLAGSLNTSFRLQNLTNVNNWLGRSNWAGDSNTAGSYNEFRIWNGPLSQGVIADNVASGPDALPSAPRIDSFTAFPTLTIFQGVTVRLSYVLTAPAEGGAFSASIDQGVGTLSGTSGYVAVTPNVTTTYTLTATNQTATRTATVKVIVLPSAPVAENLSVTAGHNTAKAITLVANDPNTPASSLTYAIVTPPTNGVLTGSGANRTYTPATGFTGQDSFTYRANDGTVGSNVATVSLTVNPPPVSPTDLQLSESIFYGDFVSGSFAGRFNSSDANPDDRFTYTLVAGAGSTHNGLFTINGNQLISSGDLSSVVGQTISLRVRVTDLAGLQFEKVLTFPVQTRPLNVLINEVNYNSARNTLRIEYIELFNPLPTPVDLSNWRLSDAVDFVFPPGSTIPAGSYLVIAQDPATMLNIYGLSTLGPWTKNLSSEGDDIRLLNASGTQIDRVAYAVTAPWPALPNGEGPSLELVHPSLDNSLGGNWRSSTVAPLSVNYLNTPNADNTWSYRKGTSEPPATWRTLGFSQDASWLTGTRPIGLFKLNSDAPSSTSVETGVTLGTQLVDMATFTGGGFNTNYRTVYFRKQFNVTGSVPRALLLRVMHNDAAIVWINGVEVARFGFPPNAPANPAFNFTNYYERGNDPWSELVLANPGAYLTTGTNVIAIQGLAKPPTPRTAGGQEDFNVYNIFDFCVDAELKNVPELTGSPGTQNSVFATTNSPAVSDIGALPTRPRSWEPTTIQARISDSQGIGNVTLSFQISSAGNYIPATLPLSNSQILANPFQPLPVNPAFEHPSNWISVPMTDDGSIAGDVSGDGIFSATIPALAHRTLVRYRISAQDLNGQSVRVPATEDPRKNFAYFIYNGVPTYTSGSQTFGSDSIGTLPVYHWLTRSADYNNLLAYSGGQQFSNSIDISALRARRYENFSGTLVVDGQVIDHALVRLRGGNSRYQGSGKRHFHFKFPKGTPFYAGDEIGTPYRMPWEDMLFNKMFGNKGNYDWGLPYEVGAKLWALHGVPTPESHWVHWRVVQNANETDSVVGDFWGLYHALEYPDGNNFLDARDLPKGNFYKMSDWIQNGEMDERFQVNGAVDFAEDFDNIRYNIHQTSTASFLNTYVNMPLWNRYNALQEAMRHYDIFVEPTGRHRVKNLIWWFEPQPDNALGRCLFMPYDWDSSFGPTFNNGWDFVHNAIFDHVDIPDSPTWTGIKENRILQRIELRNVIRELRDLVWYRDTTGRGPFDDIVDDAYGRIAAFWPADFARWPSPGALANNPGGAPWKVQDMKDFAFTGWTDTVGGDPAVGAGGRAAFLDSISDAPDVGLLPNTPTISYSGVASAPVDGIALTSSTFVDPQPGSFAAMQWRVGEVTDPNAPEYNASAPRIYEVTPVWESGEITTFSENITIPGTALRVGHTYRARVRHKDTSGRWSHWSAPAEFTTTASNYVEVLHDNLMITEFMYHPSEPAGGFLEGDYEFIELQNISTSLTLDLSNVRFTKGIDFDFADGVVASLAPGQRVLIVANAAAFAQRYGSGQLIAGVWQAGDNLSNSGEEIKLSYGAGDSIHDFEYDDATPWPLQADVGGYSLVLREPSSRPNHANAGNWRASYTFNGSPGSSDTTTYESWAATNNASSALSDDDFDGLSSLLEYGLMGSNTTNDIGKLPVGKIENLLVGGSPGNYLTISYRRSLRAEDITYTPQFSPSLNGVWSASGVLVSSVNHNDHTVTEVWRAPLPTTSGHHFGRLQITRP